jgi:release factor glutamine methyltransferase
VTVLEGDLLEPLPTDLRGRVDAVVSNPPYVAEEARDTLPADVLVDPPLAVFGGIEIYERLFAQAVGWLAPGGIVAVEIEETAAGVVAKAAAHEGFVGITVRHDLAGRDRVVVGRRPLT